MKFYIFRFVGILFAGLAIFLAFAFASPYYWDSVEMYLDQVPQSIIYVYTVAVVGAAMFLSIEE